ncbi:hypothetical protein GF360_00290 [candidate division WWE3 bacterium]|nr:hypothetical protein [candidate division WWE3 bacterium]
MYRTNKGDKLKSLLETPANLFTTDDMSVLWGIKNKNTLWKTVSRYIKRGLLYRVHKGLYAKKPLDKIDPYELGCALMGPYSYISLETVLVKEGVIFQDIPKITLIGQKTKEYSIANFHFTCKQMKPDRLLDRTGIHDFPTYAIATPERAAADKEYYSSCYYLDNPQVLDSDRFQELKEVLS